MSARAELLADRGAAAESEELFRSRPFLDAEGVTHTLRIDAEGGVLVAPLIVRAIPGHEARDAISPYGYPGMAEGSLGGVRRSLPAVAPTDTPQAPPSTRR